MPVVGKKQKPDKENSKEEGSNKKKLFFLVLAIVLVGGLAFGAMRFFGPLAGAGTDQPRHQTTETLDLGDKVLNLADQGQGRYLRVRVVLEYPQDKKLGEEIKARQPLLTEKVITVFRSKTSEDILPVKNQEKVKKELLQVINAELKNGKIAHVYFTDFLIQ